LTKLTVLYLRENSITPKSCPLKPESICKWKETVEKFSK